MGGVCGLVCYVMNNYDVWGRRDNECVHYVCVCV